MKSTLTLLAGLLLAQAGAQADEPLLPVSTPAATNRVTEAPDGERFLFVVDLSSAMKKHSLAARETVVGLICHGLDGRMITGDTFGVWTTAAHTQAGQFPMQVWDGAQPLEVASRAGRYLRAQPLGGRANFGEMLALLHSVITSVKDVNVFLITSGETYFRGTQLDEAINAQLRTKEKDARRLKRPLVVTLAARDGRVAGFTVNLAGDKLTLPPRPPKMPEMAKAKPDASKTKPAPRQIIITKDNLDPPAMPGRSAVTNPPPMVRPVTEAPSVASAPPQPPPSATTNTTSPPQTPPHVQAAASPPPTTLGEVAATNSSSPAMPDAQLAAHKTSAPAPDPSPAPTPPPPPQPDPTTPEALPEAPPTGEKVPLLEPLAKPAHIWADADPASENSPPGTPPLSDSRVPAMTSRSTNPPPTGFGVDLTHAESPLVVSARELQGNSSPVPAANQAHAMPASRGSVRALVIVGATLLMVALVMLTLIIRYQRRPAPASIITRSMDRR